MKVPKSIKKIVVISGIALSLIAFNPKNTKAEDCTPLPTYTQMPTFTPAPPTDTPIPTATWTQTPCSYVDRYEPDNTQGQAKFFNTWKAYFCDSSDVDWRKIPITNPNNTYKIWTGNLGYDCDTVMYLYDNIGTLLAENDNYEGGLPGQKESCITYDFGKKAKGLYYIKLENILKDTKGTDTFYDNYLVELTATPTYSPTPENTQTPNPTYTETSTPTIYPTNTYIPTELPTAIPTPTPPAGQQIPTTSTLGNIAAIGVLSILLSYLTGYIIKKR